MSTNRGGSDSCSTQWCGRAARRRRDGAQASREYGLPPERCSPHRADPSRSRPRRRVCDFPDAAAHVFAAELRAASHRSTLGERNRYRKAQIAAVAKWAAVEEEGETWFGFSAVRAIPGMRDEVLLVPLPGHSRGHCGFAVRQADDWLLHCGDAYFHHSEVEPDGAAKPKSLRWFEPWWTSTARSVAPIRRACANTRALRSAK